MSILAVSDRTQETAQNIGASTPITLLGAAGIGLQAFPARLDGELVPYTIEHETSGQWEVGEGVYNHAAKTLARTIVYDTSNGNTSLVNFANGIVDVWIDLPAEKAVMLDADSSNLTVPGNLTMQAGNTMALTGATVSGAPTWSSNQAITLSTAIQPNVTTMAALASVGTIATGTWNATPITTPYGGTGLTTYAAGDTLYYVSGTTLTRRAIGAANTISLSNGTNPTWAANLPYATLPTGNGSWDTGAGTTITVTRSLTVSGTLTGTLTGNITGNAATATALQTGRTINGVTFDGTTNITVTAAAGTLTGTTLNATVVTSSLTTIGTLIAGAVPASLVTAGTFGTGGYTFPSTLAVSGALTMSAGGTLSSGQTLAAAGATISGAFTASGTVAFTNASPFSLTNAQVLTLSTTAQTVGAATLTIPNFAGVSDTFAFLALAQTFSNKTEASPTFTGTIAGTPTVASAWTWSSAQTFATNTQVSSAASAAFIINGATSQVRDLQFETAGSLRWVIRANATAESGGNAGSDFNLVARDDTGAQIDAPISIPRVAGGVMTLVRPLRVSNTIGVNTAPATTVGINMISTLTGGTTQSGILSTATIDSTGTSVGRGIYAKVATAAASFTLTNAYGIHIDSGAVGAGSTITNLYGLKIENQTAGASNFALWVGSGQSRFNDAVVFQGSMSLNAVNITASIMASSASTRAIFIDPTHIAAANNDSLNGIVVSNLYTPGSFTGLTTVGIRIDGWNISGFTSPGDPVMLGVGHLTQLNGTGATNAYAIKLGAGPTGATNNYLIHATNFQLTSAGAGTFASTLTVTGGFGCNTKTPQTAFASGGAAPAGGTGTAAGGWDTSAHRDAAITLLNNIRSALVANGIMS